MKPPQNHANSVEENRGQVLVFFGGYRSLVAEDGMRLRFGEPRPLDDV